MKNLSLLLKRSSILLVILFSACAQTQTRPQNLPRPPSNQVEVSQTLSPPEISAQAPSEDLQPEETPVLEIPLDGPAALTQAEYSSMAWYQDELVLMPQYPQRMSDQPGGVLYAIPRQSLLDYIQGRSSEPIRPREIRLLSDGIEQIVPQYEGFEAIAFAGDRVYLSIEARQGLRMMGYLVSGQASADGQSIRLDLDTLTKNPPQRQQSNRSDESILIVDDQLITFFESNGAQANPTPHGTRFSLDLEPLGEISFPAVEYRLTDATEIDATGRFWMMNYFFPGDKDLLPSVDPIREKFGAGASHRAFPSVERLVEFQYTPQGISLTGAPPIQFELDPQGISRNWEGLVRLDELGFLVITDKHPRTILGFVAYAGK